jgi:hypothetical protein
MAKKLSGWGFRKRWRNTRKQQQQQQQHGNAKPDNTRVLAPQSKSIVDCYNSDTASNTSNTEELPQQQQRYACGSNEAYNDDESNSSCSDDESECSYEIIGEDEDDCDKNKTAGVSSQHTRGTATTVTTTKSADHPSPLPSPRDLSKKLCKVVFGSRLQQNPYSHYRRSALQSLSNILDWVELRTTGTEGMDNNDNRNATFLKDFLTYGGAAKVLDFLQEVLREEVDEMEEDEPNNNAHGEEFRYRIAVESVRIAASVIASICCRNNEVVMNQPQPRSYSSNSNSNRHKNKNQGVSASNAAIQHLAGVTATVVVNHDGIEMLLQASDLCCRCYDKTDSSSFDYEASLEALEKVWTAIANTCEAATDDTATLIIDDLSATVWDSGLEAMETFGTGSYGYDNSTIASVTSASFALLRASIFRAFEGILVRRRGDFLATRNLFQERGILWRSLELVSSANHRWTDDNEDVETSASSSNNTSMRSSISSMSSIGCSSNHSQNSNSCHRNDIGVVVTAEETMLEAALSFFCECHAQELIFQSTANIPKGKRNSKPIRRQTSKNSDSFKESWRFLSEGLVPLCVKGLQRFAMDNASIRHAAVRILGAAVDTGISTNSSDEYNTTNKVLLADLTDGAIEALAPFLTIEHVHILCDREKDEIRGLIRMIVGIWDGLEWDGTGNFENCS